MSTDFSSKSRERYLACVVSVMAVIVGLQVCMFEQVL